MYVCIHRPIAFDPPVCKVEGTVLPAGDVGKCLGHWWKGDLSATELVDENIKKATRAFIHYCIGAFLLGCCIHTKCSAF